MIAGKAVKQKLSKHDRYVIELSDKIKDDYDSVATHVRVQNAKRCFGEIDILAKKGDRTDLYEVKCSHRIIKARKQLNKMRKFLNLVKGNLYFYCGSSGLLLSVN